ncbi:MAG: hypothetical protein IJD28_08140 [Deferribacterales bacterium]|nr:hypothetical protein [Deferribacterales bacterium]
MFGIVSFIIKSIMLSILGITIYFGATEPGLWSGVIYSLPLTVFVFLFLNGIKKYIEEKKQRPDETDEEYQLRMEELKKQVEASAKSSRSYRHSASNESYNSTIDYFNNPMYRNFPGNIHYRNDNNNFN